MAAMRRSSRAAASALFTSASVNAVDSACSSIQVIFHPAFRGGDNFGSNNNQLQAVEGACQLHQQVCLIWSRYGDQGDTGISFVVKVNFERQHTQVGA
ncbi:MAG: hypothetical protein FRX49_06932 [Trebouxia sp. A1-2]|nr:MAG: hypothetical protein FRX49_06932 [Trebouxia sp. A1-2]